MSDVRRPALTLRVSVTDRCDLRCTYCVPEGGVTRRARSEVLSFEEIVAVVRAVSQVTSPLAVRLTGGEPLVRAGIVDLVAMLRRLDLCDLALTTNGQRLASFAPALKEAGLTRVNVSLDTLDPDRFARLTRGGNLAATLEGVEAACDSGLRPVKLNAVILRGVNDDEVGALTRFALDRGCQLRFIELMPVGEARERHDELFVPTAVVRERLEAGFLVVGPLPTEGGPARMFTVKCRATGRRAAVGFVSPRTHSFCAGCRRLRLTSHGLLRCCLLRAEEVDLKRALRNGGAADDLTAMIRQTLALKPGGCNSLGASSALMAEIGG